MKAVIACRYVFVRECLSWLLTGLKNDVEIFKTSRYRGLADKLHQHYDISLVILDASLPGLPENAPLDMLRNHHPHARVIVFMDNRVPVSQHENHDCFFDGADGYCSLMDPPKRLLRVMHKVLHGQNALPPVTPAFNPASFDKGGEPALAGETMPWGLTRRQYQILSMMAQGYSNQAIAEQLTLSIGTIKAHSQAIFRKLGVTNRTEAVLQAKIHHHPAPIPSNP